MYPKISEEHRKSYSYDGKLKCCSSSIPIATSRGSFKAIGEGWLCGLDELTWNFSFIYIYIYIYIYI